MREDVKWVAVEDGAPNPPHRRLTLTLPTLAAAEMIVVAAIGRTKAQVVREALCESNSSLPLTLVLRRARSAVIFLDPEAASLSGNPSSTRA